MRFHHVCERHQTGGSNQCVGEHAYRSEGFLQDGRMGMSIHSTSGWELKNDKVTDVHVQWQKPLCW